MTTPKVWLALLLAVYTLFSATESAASTMVGLLSFDSAAEQSLTIPSTPDEQYWIAELQIPAGLLLHVVLVQETGSRVLASYASGTEQLRFMSQNKASIRLQLANEWNDYDTPVRWSLSPIAVLPSPPVTGVSIEQVKSPQLRQWIKEGNVPTHSPIIETLPGLPESERLMTFVYLGAKHNVRILGAPVNDIVTLQKLVDSDVWFRSFTVPADTLLSYRVAPDVPHLDANKRENRVAILSRATVDPLNADVWPLDDDLIQYSRVDIASTVPLPNTPLDDQRLTRHWLHSHIFDNERLVTLYRPEARTSERPERLVILLDGNEYEHKVAAAQRIDQLYKSGLTEPLWLLLVNNPDAEARRNELPANPLYADFIADELLPWAEQHAGQIFKREQVIVAGSSYGGLAALSASLNRPDRVGHVLSMSGSFWWQGAGGSMQERLKSAEQLPLSVYLSAGKFETGRNDEAGIFEHNVDVAALLDARQVSYKLTLLSAGHDYYSWSLALEEGLTYLAGERK
ncbi:Enterochelin esterase [Marinomonas gallaica]|uniref:Enterochelin esterase n=1 Tax=Marinomonas gallaica TaxID=1806667 RepID=A0A1C3JVR2_9GAMM|nr:alpha/beta hydrolase-fold protein [Marinomonas gallaica]SBT19192.1 Enterochelin esterase [Marinomonas gallaica]SBT20881.1 Enterochelin esterase [Marinomonas gallaica]